jgi:hypothetical protein
MSGQPGVDSRALSHADGNPLLRGKAVDAEAREQCYDRISVSHSVDGAGGR